MATTRTNKVEVEITAKDEATPTIQRLEKKIDGLESDEARIIVTAQTDRLEKQLDSAKQKLEGLDGDEASVQLRAIGTLESDLDQARTLLADLDGKTGTVKINAVDTASGDIDRVDQKRRDLDGKTATVKLESTGDLGGLGKGAAGGAAGLAAGVAASVLATDDLAISVAEVAKATGAPLDQASRLVSVWKQNGFEVGDLIELLNQVNGALIQNPELAAQLGVEIGGNQNLIDQFLTTVKAVGTEFDTDSEKANAAATLFGETGQSQINRLELLFGTLDEQIRNVPKSQLIDQGDVDRAIQLNEEMVKFKGHLTEIQLMLTEKIIPFLNRAFEWPGDFADWISGPDISGTDILNATVNGRNTSSRSAPPGIRGQGVTIVNYPPGVAPTPVVNADRIYQRRNGSQ